MLELVSESSIEQVLPRLDLVAAVRAAFVAAARGETGHAPVARLVIAGRGGVNVKVGDHGRLVGGKIGTYWAGNAERGLPNHGATTLLLDPDTGYPAAVVAARLLNRWRTATGDAVAVDALARPDAGRLGLVGAGAQALFEARAIAKVRRLREIRIGARDAMKAQGAARELADLASRVEIVSIEEAVRSSDIVVTATSATAPVIAAEWVAPGTHLSAMGADAVGKQELDPALFGRAALFCDLPAQSAVIGELQHAGSAVSTPIGDVLAGTAPGRTGSDQITLFDSSGIAAQDLHVAAAALDRARTEGLVVRVDF